MKNAKPESAAQSPTEQERAISVLERALAARLGLEERIRGACHPANVSLDEAERLGAQWHYPPFSEAELDQHVDGERIRATIEAALICLSAAVLLELGEPGP
jgi:hypothetical protein